MNIWAGGNWRNGQAVGGPNLEVGVWSFMVGVKLPDVGLEAYLDGEKIATGSKKGDIDLTGNPLYIGTGGPSWLPLSGVIDEVKMFNRALKPNQIKQLMEEASVVQAKRKLACYWGQIKVENMR